MSKQFKFGKKVKVKPTRVSLAGLIGEIVGSIPERKMIEVEFPNKGYTVSIHKDDLELL